MDFNYDSGLIDTVYTLDSTQSPPATGSGVQNVLAVLGGALSLPTSATTVATPQNGMFRYNTAGYLEFYTSSAWNQLTTGSGVSISNITTNTTYYPTFTVSTSGSFTVADVSSTTLTFNPGINNGVLSTGQFVSTLATGTAPFSVSSTTAVTNLQSQFATNLYGGAAGQIHYQSTANTSAFTAAGTSNQLLQSNGTSAPTWTGAPSVSGANITTSTIPNSALANSSITIGTTTLALGATSTTLAGLTGITFASGTVTGIANPVAATDAVNLQYLQQVQSGLNWKVEAQAATTAALTVTYSNGSSGIGATLTNSGTQAAFAIDGYTASVGDRVLVKNQVTQTQNGIYVVTNTGSGSSNYILTRSSDANTTQGLDDATIFIVQGTANANTSYVQSTAAPTVGTSNIVFAQNYALTGYTSGTGITLTGNVFSNAGVLTIAGGTTGLTPASATSGAVTLAGTLVVGNGGTGLTTITTNGVLFGNGTSAAGVTTAGSQYTVLVAGSGGIPAFGSINLASSVAVGSSILPLANGGTGIANTAAAGGIAYSTASGISIAAAGTSGYFLTSGGTGAPTWTNPSSLGVTSFSAGSTGLTPSTATTGAVSLAGTLGIGYGGTGLTTAPANGAIDIGNGSTFVRTTLTGTANQITVTNGAGSITLSLPSSVTIGNLTDSGLTANSFMYPGTAGLLSSTTAATNGQLLIGSTSAAPVAAALAVTGSAIYVVNGAGSITLQGPKYYAESATAPTVAPSASASQASALGSAAVASQYGGLVKANGQFGAAGDAQAGTYVLRNTTSNATATELFLDGASIDYITPASSVVSFLIQVAAINTAVTGAGGGFQVQGVIYRGATASTTAFIGTPAITIVGRSPSGLNVSVTANTSTGALQLFATGVASTTYHWVAKLETVEVGAT